MELEVIKILISAGAAALGAWIAGYFGVRFGLSQFKRQRAFERQLDWYEQTMETLYRVHLTIDDIAKYFPLTQGNGLDELGESVPLLENQLMIYLTKADLYARKPSRDAAKLLLRKLREDRLEWLKRAPAGKVGRGIKQEQIISAFEQRRALIENTVVRLAADMREILAHV